jgi:hypothetical protein
MKTLVTMLSEALNDKQVNEANELSKVLLARLPRRVDFDEHITKPLTARFSSRASAAGWYALDKYSGYILAVRGKELFIGFVSKTDTKQFDYEGIYYSLDEKPRNRNIVFFGFDGSLEDACKKDLKNVTTGIEIGSGAANELIDLVDDIRDDSTVIYELTKSLMEAL